MPRTLRLPYALRCYVGAVAGINSACACLTVWSGNMQVGTPCCGSHAAPNGMTRKDCA